MSMLETTGPAAASVLTAAQATPAPAGFDMSDPRVWLLILAGMALAPFLLTMVTSFVKLVIVGSIIRSALGTQQVPPTQVITGLALILTIHIMWPVGREIYEEFQKIQAAAPPVPATAGGKAAQSEQLPAMLARSWQAVSPPLTKFLKRHTRPANIALFENLQRELQRAQREEGGTEAAVPETAREMTVLVPAFVLSELTAAFQIGFLIFVPFLIIDLVVSNLLLALGMMMLSPTTISLPLKLLLFVLVDGWQLIIRGVVLSYA